MNLRWYSRWGATDEEMEMGLPGDALLDCADLTATRAITIHAETDAVWPWIAQLGQGRGGFYSYDSLENLVGCDIHSANTIVPDWQDPELGAAFKLHPDVGLTVGLVDPGHALVARGGIPLGDAPPPFDFTWAFVVQIDPQSRTRLVVRERYRYLRGGRPSWWSRRRSSASS